jgi:hypothetical protein
VRGTRDPAIDCAFYLILGLALLVLFADVAVVIHRANSLALILGMGVTGFGVAFAAGMLAMQAGYIALVALVALALGLALAVTGWPPH